jgi:hypothetical protein
MDVLCKLESMAVNVSFEDCISPEDAARWSRPFGFTETEALRRIEEYSGDYSRKRVSNELWAVAQGSTEAEGFDREACEMSLGHQKALSTPVPQAPESSGTFTVQLEGALLQQRDSRKLPIRTSSLPSPPGLKNPVCQLTSARSTEQQRQISSPGSWDTIQYSNRRSSA